MKKQFTYLILLFTFLCKAQVNDSTNQNILQPSINEILQLKPEVSSETKVTIANLVETNVYEAPNIITIINEDEIKELGYRDLLDVLNNIPGINIANDVQNGTSIGVRGMWAEEGKILFMINGLIINDMAYGSIILGHRFPLSNIKRIEIIRGAGSSIYGGLAALGVINIVTKTGQEINGHTLNNAFGISNKTASRGVLNYNYGGALIKGIELTVVGHINAGNRSNEVHTLPDSSVVNFKDSSLINNIHILFTLKAKNFSYKQLYEDYNFQATFEPIASLMRTSISNLKYDFKFKKVNISPFYDYKWQIPWNTQYGDPVIYDKQNLVTKRQTIGFNGSYNPFKLLNFTYGAQFYNDFYKHYRKTLALSNGNYTQNYNGYISYLEGLITTKIININIGGRFDKYAYFNPNILPRFCISKSFKNWHYKALYGKSFKIPPLQNINLDITGTLIPETVTDIQAEIGYHNKRLDLTATVFETDIKNIIVFGYDQSQNESYVNSGNATTQGLELDLKLRLNKFSLKGNYSNYNLISCSVPEIMSDTLNLKMGTLSFPKNKIVTTLSYKINAKNNICLNYVYQTKKYAFEQINKISEEYQLIKYPDSHQINLTYQRNGLFNNFLDINVGLYNVLNTTIHYSYSFNQGYAPVIGMGRELFITFNIHL